MRPIFLIALWTLLSMAGAAGAGLSGPEKERLHAALAPLHAQYDPAEQMIRRPFSSPGYHTTLKGGMVHPARDSLNYAVALFDTSDAALEERAKAILKKVISLQDQDTQSRTYGIWSWFLEEPLAQMSPPDWNWADFCGVQLLQVALDHRDKLGPELRRILDEAIVHAANSIRKRNVGPGYTNIAIMGTYVTLVAAELYQLDELKVYGLQRLRRFYDYTREQGAFSEYNSPTYTLVALKELARLQAHVRSTEARPLIEVLYNTAWKEIALHFHPPTRQWAGPHSRAYRSLMNASDWAFLSRATDRRIDIGSDKPSLDEHRIRMPLPAQFEPHFRRLDEPREQVQTFLRGTPAIVGTTYLHPAFALGSVNNADFWNQRRGLIAYFGTAENPAYLHLRFLHDHYDFAAAQLFTVQDKSRVLAGVTFATDGGDTHVSLDRVKQGRLKARDLRLRFEFGGSASNAQLRVPEKLTAPSRVDSGRVGIGLAVPVAVFGEEQPHWESGQGEGKSWLDLVLFSGASREIDLTSLGQAALAVVIQLAEGNAAIIPPQAQIKNQRVEVKWNGMKLEFPARPAPGKALTFSSTVND